MFQEGILKYSHSFFLKRLFVTVGSKKILNLLKFDSNEYTLLPNDKRKILIDGILRDFFLSMDSNNSDYIICKSKWSQDLYIHFTGTYNYTPSH